MGICSNKSSYYNFLKKNIKKEFDLNYSSEFNKAYSLRKSRFIIVHQFSIIFSKNRFKETGFSFLDENIVTRMTVFLFIFVFKGKERFPNTQN